MERAESNAEILLDGLGIHADDYQQADEDLSTPSGRSRFYSPKPCSATPKCCCSTNRRTTLTRSRYAGSKTS
ncbi:MAG: hypothetical protein MZU79_01605 [Anaerotruncus sp.]|nr:hypothetical protein [Anaerotruncus sp.]